MKTTIFTTVLMNIKTITLQVQKWHWTHDL